VLSTGDEVVEPTTGELGPGQIRDANRSMLLAAAAAAGAVPIDMGIARDTEGDLEGAFAAALDKGADVVVTSGESGCVVCVCFVCVLFVWSEKGACECGGDRSFRLF
jgi:molybdopterin biosynthesis enzyme